MKSKVEKGARRWGFWKIFGLILLFLFLSGAGAIAGFVYVTIRDMPVVSLTGYSTDLTSLIYDAQGNLVAQLHAEENRLPVSLDKIPEHVQNAFIAIEDHEFYHHRGFDLRGIIRAFYTNLTTNTVQGGSTITQQLVKNAFLTPQRTYQRKIQEIILAVQLERLYTKKEILEMYLNQIPLGHGTYGVQAAAKLYFGKDISQVTVGEAALLAGLTQAPSLYSPYNNLKLAKERQEVVLEQMVRYGFLKPEEADKARAEPLKLAGLKPQEEYKYPYFVDYVLKQLLNKYGKDLVYRGGLKIYTTLDARIQAAAEKAVTEVMDQAYPLKPGTAQPEAAVIVMDPHTGYIKAIVGGRTHDKRLAFNRAIDAKRQPGSAFKPIAVYTPAIEKGYTAATVIDDSYVSYPQADGKTWAPDNYDFKFRGLTPLREAVEQSINVVAVKVLDRIGIKTGFEFAQKMGITTLVPSGRQNDYTLSLALGGLTVGVTPLEMTGAYAILANGGVKMKPLTILKVLDKDGNVLEEHSPQAEGQVVSPQTAYIMTDIMKGTVIRGTGTRGNIGRPLAAKTGTTSDYVDGWFIGYTPELVGTVWVGYDQPKSMYYKGMGVGGGIFPAMIFNKVMTEALKDVPVKDFPEPRNIVRVAVCRESGKLPTNLCPADHIRTEIFVKGTEPTTPCDVHVQATVCALCDGKKLATPDCPPQDRITKVFIKRPEPYQVGPKGQKPLDADLEVPTEYCDVHKSSSGQAPSLPPGTGSGQPQPPSSPGQPRSPGTP